MRQDYGAPHIGHHELPPSAIYFDSSATNDSTEFALPATEFTLPDSLAGRDRLYVAEDKKDRRNRSDRRNGERRIRSRRLGDRRGTDRRGPDRRHRA